MPEETPLERTIRKLEEAEARVKRATRDANSAAKAAHEATRELRVEEAAFQRRIDEKLDSMATQFRTLFDATAAPLVKKGLDDYHASIKEHTDATYARVNEQFRKLTNLMMYGNEEGGEQTRHVVSDWIKKMVRDEVQRYLAQIEGMI